MPTQAGEKIVKFDFLPKQECDKLSDETMAEIIRRAIGTINDSNAYGTLWVGPTAPLDKRRPWLVQDPITGLATGSLLYWNESEGAWLPSKNVPNSNIQSRTVEITGNGTFSVSWPKAYSSPEYMLSIVAIGDPAGASFFRSSQSSGGAAVTASGWTANFTILFTGLGDLA